MGSDNATDQMQRELGRAVEALRVDLDRVELLTAALVAFSRPILEYEPTFCHVGRTGLVAHELGDSATD